MTDADPGLRELYVAMAREGGRLVMVHDEWRRNRAEEARGVFPDDHAMVFAEWWRLNRRLTEVISGNDDHDESMPLRRRRHHIDLPTVLRMGAQQFAHLAYLELDLGGRAELLP